VRVAARQRDVKVRILSEYYDAGSKAAERATRRLAAMQMAAAAEDARREQAKADAIIAANRRQMDAMQATGRVVLGVSAAIAVGLGISAKAAMDWESAFAGVRKVVDGSPEEISQLESELRGLARTLPAAHEEIAGVAEVAGQLGVRRQDIAAFTRTAIAMGETTNMAADEAATSMAQFSNIMGIAADQSDRLGSTIVALGNNGASTERDIVSMGLRIAGAGRTVGMTADEVLAVASALSSVGLEADAGGSAISRVLIRIDKDVRSGADTLATYAAVSGMTVEEFSRAWREDAAGALTTFVTGLGRTQKAGGDVNAVLDRLGFTEIRVTDALRRAALAGDLLTDAIELGTRAWDANIALQEEAAKRYQTTEARLQIARNQLNDTAIDIGGHLLPVLTDAVEWVGSLAVGFGSLPAPVQEWTAKLGLAALALTGVVGGVATAVPKLQALQKTVVDLRGGQSLLGRALGGTASILTGPWGLAIAGAVTVLGLWVKAQGDAKKRADEVSATLDQQTGAVTDNTREWALNQLATAGAVDRAKKLGIELNTLVDAAMDPTGEAARELARRYDELRAAAEESSDDTTKAAGSFSIAGDAMKFMSEDALALGNVLRELGIVQGDVAAGQDKVADRIAAGVTATEDASDAHDIYNSVLRDGNRLVEDGAAAVDELARALKDLNGPALDAEAAESRYQETLDEVNAAIAEHVEELTRQYQATGMSESAARRRAEAEVAAADKLDLSTETGRRYRAVLRDIATAAMDRANALMRQTGDEDAYRASLEQSRQALADAAMQYGMTEEAAWEYVDSVLAIPDEAAVRATFEAEEAERRMAAFVNHWSGYQIPLSVTMSEAQAVAAIQRVQRRAGAYVMQAEGGILEFYAGGGLRPMRPVAQVVPPNTWRVVGDHPVADELYVPLDGTAQSRAIWEEGGRRMGWSTPPTVVVQSAGTGPADLAAALDGISLTLMTEAGPIRGLVRAEVTGAQGDRTAALVQGVR